MWNSNFCPREFSSPPRDFSLAPNKFSLPPKEFSPAPNIFNNFGSERGRFNSEAETFNPTPSAPTSLFMNQNNVNFGKNSVLCKYHKIHNTKVTTTWKLSHFNILDASPNIITKHPNFFLECFCIVIKIISCIVDCSTMWKVRNHLFQDFWYPVVREAGEQTARGRQGRNS